MSFLPLPTALAPAEFAIQVCGLGARICCQLLAQGHSPIAVTYLWTPPAQNHPALPAPRKGTGGHTPGFLSPGISTLRAWTPRACSAHSPDTLHAPLPITLVQSRREVPSCSGRYSHPAGSALSPLLGSFPTSLSIACNEAVSRRLCLQILSQHIFQRLLAPLLHAPLASLLPSVPAPNPPSPAPVTC